MYMFKRYVKIAPIGSSYFALTLPSELRSKLHFPFDFAPAVVFFEVANSTKQREKPQIGPKKDLMLKMQAYPGFQGICWRDAFQLIITSRHTFTDWSLRFAIDNLHLPCVFGAAVYVLWLVTVRTFVPTVARSQGPHHGSILWPSIRGYLWLNN